MTTLEPARDQIEMFVDALLRHRGSEGFISLRTFHENEAIAASRVTAIPLKGNFKYLVDAAEDDARRAANDPKAAVFCPPLAVFNNPKRAREEDIALGLVLSVECDEHPRQAREKLEALLGPATVVVRSGGQWMNGSHTAQDKLHVHWRLKTPAKDKGSLAKLKQAREMAAQIADSDTSNNPVCHPIRWPGSWHRKAEPRLCTIEAIEPDCEIDLDTALAALLAAAPAANTNTPGTDNLFKDGDSKKTAWLDAINAILAGTDLHKTTTVMAAKLVRAGWEDGANVNLLRALMAASAAPRDDRFLARYKDLPRAVSTARAKLIASGEVPQSAPDKQPRVELHWYNGDEEETGQAWLVEDLLPETGVGLVSGQWGTYKTFFLTDLAASIMTGKPFIGFPVVRRGGVLFIAAEGANQVRSRLKAVLKQKHDAVASVPFVWADCCPRQLLDADALDVLTEIARVVHDRMLQQFGVPLVLIVVDTLGAAAGFNTGEENDAATNQRLMNTLSAVSRASGALVLAADHFGKQVETGTRGSSAKEAAADVVLALLGTKDVGGKVTNARMAVRKSRAGPTGDEFAFTVQPVQVGTKPDGTRVLSLYIDWSSAAHGQAQAAKAREKWPKSLRLFHQSLLSVLASEAASDQRPFHDGPVVRAVDLEKLRAEFYPMYPAEGDAKAKAGARRTAFNRALKQAQADKLIGVRDIEAITYVWLVASVTPTTPTERLDCEFKVGDEVQAEIDGSFVFEKPRKITQIFQASGELWAYVENSKSAVKVKDIRRAA